MDERGKGAGEGERVAGAPVDLACRIWPWTWPRWAALLQATYDRPTPKPIFHPPYSPRVIPSSRPSFSTSLHPATAHTLFSASNDSDDPSLSNPSGCPLISAPYWFAHASFGCFVASQKNMERQGAGHNCRARRFRR